MGELAEAVLLNHPTLTKMVDRMVFRRPGLPGPGCRRPAQGADVQLRSRKGPDPALEFAGA